MTLRGLWVVLALMLVVAAPLDAQRQDGRRGDSGRDRVELERRLRARVAQMIQERLQLSPEESDSLEAVVGRFDSERRDLARREMALRRRVEAFLLEDSQNNAEALELLNGLVALRHEEADLRGSEQDALLQVLTPTQLIQLQQIRQQIGERIRRLREGDDGRRRRSGGDGGRSGDPGLR